MNGTKQHDVDKIIAINKNLRDAQWTLDRLAQDGEFLIPELGELAERLDEARKFALMASLRIKDRPGGAMRRLYLVK